jgi:hypothetical protein
LSPLRQLVSQTAVYGLSSIVGRFLNYLLVPLYTYTFSAGEYGVVSEFYAYAGFFAIVLMLGLETGYFRFRQNPLYDASQVYSSAMTVLVLLNLGFVAAAYHWQRAIAQALQYPEHPEYGLCFAAILACDAVTALPFAQLLCRDQAERNCRHHRVESVFSAVMPQITGLVAGASADGLLRSQCWCRLYLRVQSPGQRLENLVAAAAITQGACEFGLAHSGAIVALFPAYGGDRLCRYGQ